MCLWAQGTEDNDGGVGRVRRARKLSDKVRGVGRRRGIYEASKGLEKTTEAAGDRRRTQVIYDNNIVVGGER